MNLFDGLQSTMFDTVTNTMGYQAMWTGTPAGSIQQIAWILYTGPTEKEKIFQADFDPEKLIMEYKAGDFIGLKDLQDDNQLQDVLIVGIGTFKIKSVKLKFDGKTFEARLQRPKGDFGSAFNNSYNV